MTERGYTRRDLLDLFNADPNLIKRYADLHSTSLTDTREIIIEIAVMVGPDRYGEGGVMGHIERLCEAIEETKDCYD